jgi:hypothetical protein
MPNWKTYKGEGPWEFSKSQAEYKYNVGNAIKNGGEPVWDINATTGIPITPTHFPNCGMWNGIEAPGYPPLTPVVNVSWAPRMTFMEWTPNYGGALGRFVGLFFNELHYSDNGGISWTTVVGSIWDTPPIRYVSSLFYYNNTFIATYYNLGGPIVFVTSVDGITWTQGDAISGTVWGLSYNPDLNLFFAGNSIGGDRARAISSANGINWTVDDGTLQLFTQIKGAAYYKDYGYLFSNNQAVVYKSDMSLYITPPPIRDWYDVPAYENPTAYTYSGINKGEAAVDNFDSVMVFDNCYFKDGVWTINGNPCSCISYNGSIPMFGTISKVAGLDRTISVGYDGSNWSKHTVVTTYPFTDVSVGNDRVIGVAWDRLAIVTF